MVNAEEHDETGLVMTTKGIMIGEDGLGRCAWQSNLDDYRRYHDEEWGRPVTDDRRLFEKICLEGFQSGMRVCSSLRRHARGS